MEGALMPVAQIGTYEGRGLGREQEEEGYGGDQRGPQGRAKDWYYLNEGELTSLLKAFVLM